MSTEFGTSTTGDGFTSGPGTTSSASTSTSTSGPEEPLDDTTTGSSSVQWTCPEPRAALSEPLIDDFEAPDLPPYDGREGGWYVYNDGSGGTQIPENTIERTEDEPHRGRFAARTHGSGFSDWGAAMALAIQTTGLETAGNCPYDASAFDGISFWARGEGQILFHITTMNTAPTDQGGRCTDTAHCWDDFGQQISLTETWTHYTISWDDLRQAGWGVATSFDPREILLLHWQDQSASSFDIMLDDVAFHRSESTDTSTGSASETDVTSGDGSETTGAEDAATVTGTHGSETDGTGTSTETDADTSTEIDAGTSTDGTGTEGGGSTA